MKDLYIRWCNGNMTIHMDMFFPTTQKNMKILLDTVALDFQHEAEHIQDILNYCKESVEQCAIDEKCYGKKYLEDKQNVADWQRIVSSRKHPNGVPLTKEELTDAKEKLKLFKSSANSSISDMKAAKRKKERFQRNIEQIEKKKIK